MNVKHHVEKALEHTISGLSEAGYKCSTFSQGEGQVPGITYYNWKNEVVAQCDWQNGLEVFGVPENTAVAALIRSNCSLYYAANFPRS